MRIPDGVHGGSMRPGALRAIAAGILCACGGAAVAQAHATPSASVWDRSADAACHRANVAIDALPSPSSLKIEIAEFRNVVAIGRRETTAIAALPRPAADARQIAEFVALGEDGAPLANEVIAALQRADAATLAALEKRSGVLNDRYNALARRLGADTCAINPQPGTTRKTAPGLAA